MKGFAHGPNQGSCIVKNKTLSRFVGLLFFTCLVVRAQPHLFAPIESDKLIFLVIQILPLWLLMRIGTHYHWLLEVLLAYSKQNIRVCFVSKFN